MKRKVTGWFLFLLMTLFTVTAHSSLRYCLCNDEVTLGECYCEQTNFSSQQNQQSDPCKCCGSCEQKKSNTKSVEQSISANCDCMINLIVQLDDFTLTSSDDLNYNSSSRIYQPHHPPHQDTTSQTVILAKNIHAPRGSPPPMIVTRLDVPIYLRDSVYRL